MERVNPFGMESTVQLILVVAGKTVVVAVMAGVVKVWQCVRKVLGAQVIVTEINAIKAVEAYMDGFAVMPMVEAAKVGDFFVTVTGNTRCDSRQAL